MATTVYLYDPNTATTYNISAEVAGVEIDRGRSRELDEINAGTCRVRVHNQTGNFNPYFLTTNSYLLLETGDNLLLEDGGRLILDAVSTTSGAYGVMNVGRFITVKDGSTLVFSGFVEDFEYEWRHGKIADATLVCADGLARLARQSWLEWSMDADNSGDVLAFMVSRGSLHGADFGWATSTSIPDGLSNVPARTIAYGTNVLSDMQAINRAEQGRFFVSRSNVLTFQNRLSTATGTAVCNFLDTATGQVAGAIPFAAVEVTFGSELLYTKVSVDIVSGGTVQTADDLTAQANYGVRHLTMSGVLLSDNGQALDMANYLVNRFGTPEAVVSEITVKLEKLSSANRATVAAIEIGNTVTFNWTPTVGFAAVSQTLVVEGVGYSFAHVKGELTATDMTFQLSAGSSNSYFILAADANASLLDTGQVGF
jgi:hypothetical protein